VISSRFLSSPLPFIALRFIALRFSALVGRRGGVAAWNARAATATPLIRYLVPGSPHAGSGVFPRLFGSLLLSGAMALSAAAQNAPGVTDREIKIGQTMPYTGPGAWLSSLGLAEKAYMQMINDQGRHQRPQDQPDQRRRRLSAVATGNETRKLIEVDHVAFTFGSLGRPLSSRSRNISTSEKFRSCSSRAALTAGAITRRHPIRSAACARATGWERVFTPTHTPAGSKRKNLHPL
jgi:hypothetical protein